MILKLSYHKELEDSNNLRQHGFSLIELLIVVVILGIIASIAVPNLLASRRAANEATAISNIRTISGGEATYLHTAGNSESYGGLTQLYNARIIDITLGTAPFTKQQYRFEIDVLPPENGLLPRFDARAIPLPHILVHLAGAGGRDFGINESGVVYQTTDNTRVAFDAITRLPQGSSVPMP